MKVKLKKKKKNKFQKLLIHTENTLDDLEDIFEKFDRKLKVIARKSDLNKAEIKYFLQKHRVMDRLCGTMIHVRIWQAFGCDKEPG